MEIIRAKQIVEQIEQEKRKSLEGGGKDFQGALKRLVGIWNNPSHALIELLQNADDTEAKLGRYEILKNGIIFSHNGHPFKENEIKAICSVDDSTKDVEKHTGFMGIGFKAVFKLSSSPSIFCRPWQFLFSSEGFPDNNWGWILVPRWVNSIPPEAGEILDDKTVYWLPYKEELSKETIQQIEQEIFERFDSLCLMFLRKIEQIQIVKADGTIRLLHREKNAVIDEKNGKKTTHNYKVFKKLFKVPEEAKAGYLIMDSGRDKAKVRELVLAYALDAKNNLQLKTNSPLYTYLPTDYIPGLRFIVQSDFILDTQRSYVDESLEWNRWLWRCVNTLLQKAIEGFTDEGGDHIEGFKENEELRYQFYRILPSKGDFPSVNEKSLIRNELLEPFWNYCQENKIIITSLNTWVKPSEAVIASQEIQRLLDTTKLKILTEREYFVHHKVQGSKEVLNEMGVVDLPEQKIIEVLKDEAWVNSKENEWFRVLYVLLSDRLQNKYQNGWWEIESQIRDLPIVRTSQKTAKKPSEVLFPPEDDKEATLVTGIPGIAFVAKDFLDDDSKKLLEHLGVQVFSAENVIRTTILKAYEDGGWKNWPEEARDRCIKFIHEWLKQQDWKVTAELRRKLGAVRIKTEGNTLARADRCYFSEPRLKLLYPQASFVVCEENNSENADFLLALGIADKPRILTDNKQYERTNSPYFTLHWDNYWSWLSRRNYLEYSTGYRKVSEINCIEYWDEIQWSPEKAEIMLSHLMKHWDNDYKNYIESQYEYFHSKKRSKNVPSYMTYQLSETKWLPTTKGLMNPSDKIFVPSPKIKKVAGNIVSYLSIPNNWEEKEFLSRGHEFFKFLGLSTELNIEALKYLLDIIRTYPVNSELKSYLSKIYQALGKCLDENTECELNQIKLLTLKETFEHSLSLYWNDDHDLGDHFQDDDHLYFAWIPENVERRYIETFLERAGVKAVSKYIERKLVTSAKGKTDNYWTDLLRSKTKYIYSLLKHHKAYRADITGEKMGKLEAISLDAIELLLSLGKTERVVTAKSFYDIDSNAFYLTQNTEDFEIALELARVFGLDFGYLSDIEVILHEKDSNRLEERLQRQGIALLDLETEPLPIIDRKSEEPEDIQQKGSAPEIPELKLPQKSSTSHHRQVQRIGLPYDDRMKEEASNIEKVIKFEERNGRKSKDVSKEYRGYDLESINEASGEIRCIEIKAPSYVMLTPHEYEVAKIKGLSYFLYVVDNDILYIIQDPVNSCGANETETLETRWKLAGWKENASKYELLT